jgi:hypothetical protein
MWTECSAEQFDFGSVEGRAVDAAFDGGLMTSDARALLLGAASGHLAGSPHQTTFVCDVIWNGQSFSPSFSVGSRNRASSESPPSSGGTTKHQTL